MTFLGGWRFLMSEVPLYMAAVLALTIVSFSRALPPPQGPRWGQKWQSRCEAVSKGRVHHGPTLAERGFTEENRGPLHARAYISL